MTDPTRELELDLPEVVAEVRAVFERYEAALLANDVPVLEALFWNSPRTIRYGVGENLHGWDEISAFRRARRTGAFRRELRRTVIKTFGRDFATADTEYLREGFSRLGRESKTLVRTPAGWRIVSAHVSLIGETV
jgi:hypothetical protein